MVKILAFDTETTDKGPVGDTLGLSYYEKKKIDSALIDKNTSLAKQYWEQWINHWPYITQLSYIVYDTENPKKSKIFNKYIDIPEEIQISSKSSEITHIFKSEQDIIQKGIKDENTGELITPETQGLFILNRIKERISIFEAIEEFMEDVKNCHYIVAHNVDFDKKMILAELKRLNKDSEFYNILTMDNFVCTMMRTINVCKIQVTSKMGKKYFKFPKLKEAYEKLFGYEPTSQTLHNAIVDVVVCLRIFCKLGEPIDLDICGTNEFITQIINSISPEEFQYLIKKTGKPIELRRSKRILERSKC
jgi:DNA polymerase III epsilon subunit-like protein